MPASARGSLVATWLFFFHAVCAEAAEADTALVPTPSETVVVTANAPLPGTDIDADKIPGEVQSLNVPDLLRDRESDVLPNAIATQFSSVNLNDEQGSPFQPDFVYRGFEASPISGKAEGIAVYQDGVRLNEAFGDNVNWDLVPEFAVDRFTLQSNNPVFGLNAIGGAVSLTMKDGFNFQGADAELSGGSFGNVTGNAEYGAKFGKLGVYVGVGRVSDDGFRFHSPTTLRQAYGDIGYEDGRFALHLSVTGALNNIAALGPTPVEMLARDPRAVFTFPQSMENEMELVQLNGTYRAGDTLTLSASTYYRHFVQHLIDGNTTDVDYCENDPSQLCLEGNGQFPDDALYDAQGKTVPASALPPDATLGEIDHTQTSTNSVGSALQASRSIPVGEHENSFAIGASIDHSVTDYAASGEIGVLLDNLKVVGSGIVIDQSNSPTAQPPLEAPVAVRAQNNYIGFYAIDVFNLTPRLAWTLDGRLNVAQVSLDDLIGSELNSRHNFTRLNPGTGLTYKLTSRITAYAGYSESNRAPTAGELSCANPTSPCLLDAFLVSDPDLKQVVSHNSEFGLRGGFRTGFLPGAFTWNASLYRTDSDDDILLLATNINGFGFFQNAGTTRRQGLDAHIAYRDERWRASMSYSYLDATFLGAETLSSNSPAADADGLIQVHPGDRLPLNPAHRVTLSLDYSVTPAWSVGADLRTQSGQYLIGDESNQEPKLPGYAAVTLRSEFQLDSHLRLFGEIENLFDRRYYTYGAFAELDGLPPNFNLTNPRTYSPAPGRSFFAGIRASL